ncbi:AraC family transcriptional regulator [[Clostridium] polysaccharolyticum]|uniref:AraC-type DNA-binding protein n=1 Tax=[Clostridium] polysaccharolyticum TaxID=29364 RepID=A0A1I0CGJ0_9FIRM|nr:AraC family transcriptional regulator [[Clostridium] polysaccharolyticum]SET18716.1 AraC-type DNA-binding protein [[Clostridium] polysaccharolyticum]
MPKNRTYDECYFLNYAACADLQLYEIGKQACPPSYSYGPTVRNHYIFHYLFEGKGILKLNGKQYTITAHQGFLISPNILAYYEADPTEPWNYAWVHLDGPKIRDYFQKCGLSSEQPVFKPSLDSNEIDLIMLQLLEHNTRELYCIGKIYELFDAMIAQSVTKEPANIDIRLTYIKKIIDYITIKFSEPIHMNDIAHACGLERSYMTRLFKDATGQTPYAYLNIYRIKKACQLLLHDSASIQNIAYAVGYSDAFTFSKAFKRQVGVSPSEYRGKSI